MNLSRIFEVFSRRPRSNDASLRKLTESFRNRVLMLCRDCFGDSGYGNEFWDEVHKKLQYLHGKPRLMQQEAVNSPVQDALAFLLTCNDDHFLDFLEYIFQVECYWRVFPNENEFVEQLNELFLVDDLPYAVTSFVRETRQEQHFGQLRDVQALAAFPKIICREDQATYLCAIKPVLNLLLDEVFTSANLEFIEALEDYRKGDYGDCFTKCGSAFESTLKIICFRNGWSYKQDDTASKLLQTVVEKSNLESFFEQPLIIIATLRNRLSKSHGLGTQQRHIPPHKAQYAINATAAAILLLVEECK